ncbi:MAG: LysM peptidoglycan-binding domain-containing protein [Bacteroidia bacterium]|nr:LysM peptidoglycan-binding domain-containing protein [Bacteroidia bacterium]
MKTFVLVCVLGISNLLAPSGIQRADDVLERMHTGLEKVYEHSYRLQLRERKLDRSFHQGQMLIQVKNNPLKIRAEILGPKKGLLVEYNAAEDMHEATIIPKQWLPAVKIKSDIHGDILRKGHYAINETSLNYFDKIIKRLEQKFKQKGDYGTYVKNVGLVATQGRSCFKIELSDPSFHIRNYTVKAGENLLDISKRLLIHPFKIRELNPQLDSYYELAAGRQIRIPSSYAKRCVIYIDNQEFLPRRLEVYDESGMFEQYSFHDIHVKK